MATAAVRQRRRGGPGILQWTALGGAALVILGLTFALGVLVGRQWARQTHPAVAADPAHKAAPAPRRGGLTEVAAERPLQPHERLTFYQTLTAPLGAAPLSEKGQAPAKPIAPAKPQVSPGKTPGRGNDRTMPAAADGQSQERPRLESVEARATEEHEGASPGLPFEPKDGQRADGGERQEARTEWTVQVGVFSSPQQAAGVKKRLAEGGFEAQVMPMSTEDGQTRYRVRVGAFRSKEEAVRTAERVRSERSLPTFVTAK